MRSLKTIIVLIISVLASATFIFSDASKVRVTASRANIRLSPNTQSPIISTIPLGAVLDVIKKEGNWYYIKLPPDEKGIIVTGYIHQSIVEVIEEIKEIPKEEKVKEEKPPEVTPLIIEKPPVIKEEIPPRADEFSKEGKYLTPQVGINSWAIPFGVNFEYGLKKNIGIGATAMMWLWGSESCSHTIVDLAASAAYHFTGINVNKLDLYAGGGLGIIIYSWRWKEDYEWLTEGGAGSSGIYIIPFVGARYFFSPKIAVHLRLGGTLMGSWTGFGSTIGITFSL